MIPLNLLVSTGDSYVNLSWEAPPDDGGSSIINYNIYRIIQNGQETFIQTTGDRFFFNDTGLTNGHKYIYYISAVNNIGEGMRSSDVQAIPLTTPTSPENLQAFVGDNYVNLVWDPPVNNGGSEITNYTIFRGLILGNETPYVTLGNLSSYNDTSVINDLTYYYKIKAVNIIGASGFSEIVNATPESHIIPINKPPICIITYPKTGSIIRGSIKITGTAYDEDGIVQKVELRIDEGGWMEVEGTHNWSYQLDTEELSNSEHIIIVRAYDNNSYSLEENIIVEVDNPSQTPGNSIIGILGLLILIASLIIFLLLLWKRRNMKKPTIDSDLGVEKIENRKNLNGEEIDNVF